jgi:hypothetical protein
VDATDLYTSPRHQDMTAIMQNATGDLLEGAADSLVKVICCASHATLMEEV